MTDSVSLQCHRGGALSFIIQSRTNDETKFQVSCGQPNFKAKCSVSSHVVGTPDTLFSSIAKDWKGWPGEKTWEDLEHRVILSCRMDSTGHAWLTVSITNYENSTSFSTELMFESGMLGEIARRVSDLFSNHVN